jgi:hypothetical protein
VGVGESAEGNQRAGAEEIVGGGDVVAGFIPVVGQPQQGEVGEIECDKDQRKDQPQGKVLVYLLAGLLPRGKSEEGEDCRLRGLGLVQAKAQTEWCGEIASGSRVFENDCVRGRVLPYIVGAFALVEWTM